MSPTPPFVDRATGTVNATQILAEAIPLAKLIGVFVALALGPLLFVFSIAGDSLLGIAVTVVAQFILAVGAGIVLMYVITRAIQLAEN